MRQLLLNGNKPADWTSWPKHDANWSIVGNEFVATCDGTTSYIGQNIPDLKVGDIVTFKYNITASSADGSLVLSGAGSFGGVALNETVALHEARLSVTNASPAYDFYIAITGGLSGSITIDSLEIWVKGEMLVNIDSIASTWGW